MAQVNQEREYLTAVSIERGIITLIQPDGSIGFYRQRGLGMISDINKQRLINRNLLDPRWKMVKELPKNWSIEFEDEEIMGKARASFPLPNDLKQVTKSVNKPKASKGSKGSKAKKI